MKSQQLIGILQQDSVVQDSLAADSLQMDSLQVDSLAEDSLDALNSVAWYLLPPGEKQVDWIVQDSNVINSSEYYRLGTSAPSHGVLMSERSYSVSHDDFIIGGVAVMFFIMSAILYRSRYYFISRIKDFFASKRQYSDEHLGDSSNEGYNIFLLDSISALSISLILFDMLADMLRFNPVLGIPYWLIGAGYVALMVFVYAKAFIYSLVNWVFFDSERRKNWMRAYSLLTPLTAFIFYPLALVDLFFENSSEIVILCVIFVVFVYELLLFYKLNSNFRSGEYGFLLIFLYFCSVEVMPALVLWRILSGASDSFIVNNILF